MLVFCDILHINIRFTQKNDGLGNIVVFRERNCYTEIKPSTRKYKFCQEREAK